MSGQVLLTAESLQKLKEEVNQLKTVQRKEVAEKIFHAKEQGDLSENAEYAAAKDEQSFLEGKIAELEEKIHSAVIVDNKDATQVNLGCTVKIVDDSGKEQSFTIVSFNEADPSINKISNASPLGSALLGCKKGEKVEVKLPAGPKVFTVLEISYR